MQRFLVAFVLAAATFSAFVSSNSLYQQPENIDNVQIQVVDDINKFRQENPTVKLSRVPSVTTSQGPSSNGQPLNQFIYRLGRRTSGDQLVAQTTNGFQYPNYQDIQLVLNYPQNGVGAVITFVDIIVYQNSNIGDAYVIQGGIGQRQISILVEARNILYFQYQASIYGY